MKKYYGKPETCPCCNQERETLSHTRSCSSDLASDFRSEKMDCFQSNLMEIGTPDGHIEEIIHGITN